MAMPLSVEIDGNNDAFANAVKCSLLGELSAMSTASLEWLVMEHYQFFRANVGFLRTAVDCTRQLAEPGVVAELARNADEEDGHAAMYREAMRRVGTDVDRRVEFAATTRFLTGVGRLCAPDPSRALGAFYATETAAIFEHESFDAISRELCGRRGHSYDGSLIKRFHDIHLADGVEQGCKDGLAAFVDAGQVGERVSGGEPIDPARVRQGALDAIDVMRVWWGALLGRALPRSVTVA